VADYTLYGADFSMYSGKVRAYLRYKLFDFDDVLSTVDVYKKIIVINIESIHAIKRN